MPRKGRFDYDPENTAPDGHYIVGKNRPPESGKFKKGDGRRRGRRPKGTRNLATDLREELENSVMVTVGGVAKKVTRQRAIVMRMADNATKGQVSAIALALDLQQRLIGPIHEREEQERTSKKEWDFSRCTHSELLVMEALMAKVEGVDKTPTGIVGIIPIVEQGKYVGGDIRKDVQAGLRAYGIEIEFDASSNFVCRLIAQEDQPGDGNSENCDASDST